MRLLLSGEGPTDLGQEKPCPGAVACVPGPMAWMVDKLLERYHTGYSMLEAHQAGADCVTYVQEKALTDLGRRGSAMCSSIGRRVFTASRWKTAIYPPLQKDAYCAR